MPAATRPRSWSSPPGASCWTSSAPTAWVSKLPSASRNGTKIAAVKSLTMKLGEILIERRQITQEDIDRALELQRERGDKIGKILVDLGFVAQRDILSALGEQLQVPVLSIDAPPAVSPELETLSPRFLRQFRCYPVAQHDH